MESIKLECRAIIKFMLKEWCNVTTIHQRLVAVYGHSVPYYCTVTRWFNECNVTTIHQRLIAVYGHSVPYYCTVTRWFNEFKHVRQSLEDDPRSGRPSVAVNLISVAAVEKLIMANRRVKVS